MMEVSVQLKSRRVRHLPSPNLRFESENEIELFQVDRLMCYQVHDSIASLQFRNCYNFRNSSKDDVLFDSLDLSRLIRRPECG